MNRTYPVPLKQGLTYGPIASKRLGRSLGINLSGSRRKLCDYNCVYCFYGQTHGLPQMDEFPDADDVLIAVEEALISDLETDWLTFSGNGESTIHPDFFHIVKEVRELVKKHRLELRIALLSNGSTITDAGLEQALELIDLPILKLDAGNQDSFRLINRPIGRDIKADMLIDRLHQLARRREITMQTVLFDGEPSNGEGTDYDRWSQAVTYINPHMIQIYTLDFSIGSIKPLTVQRLQNIAGELAKNGVKAQVYYEEAN